MKYLITGEIIDTGEKVSPEQFTQVLNKGIIITPDVFNELGFDEKISTDGIPDDPRTGLAIVDGDSHEEVNSILQNFPSWCRVNWTVTSLGTF